MSDGGYSDEEFDAPPSKDEKPSAKSALLAAAASVEVEEQQQQQQQQQEREEEDEEEERGEREGKKKKEKKKKTGGAIPSAAVPVAKSKRKTKNKSRTSGGAGSPKASGDFKPYQSSIWNPKTPGYNSGSSRFTKSVELMKKSGFEDIFATGGTKIASSLMHVSYAGDTGSVEKILKGVKAKKGKKSRYDSDSDDSSVDSVEKKVVGWSTVRAGKTWQCDLVEKDEQGWTCMHYAASKGQEDVVEALAKADLKRIKKLGGGGEGEGEDEDEDEFDLGGVDDDAKTPLVNIKDDLFGWTPLFLAVIELHVDTVERLLENGADANMKDDLGDSPLDCVMKTKASRKRTDIRKLLKEYMKDENGELSSESESEEEEDSDGESSSDED